MQIAASATNFQAMAEREHIDGECKAKLPTAGEPVRPAGVYPSLPQEWSDV